MRFLSIFAFLILAQATPLYPNQPTKSFSAWACSLLAFSGISSIAYGVYDWCSNRRSQEYENKKKVKENLQKDRETLLNLPAFITFAEIKSRKLLSSDGERCVDRVISSGIHNPWISHVHDAINDRLMRIDNHNTYRYRSHMAILTGFSLLTASIGMIYNK